MEISIDSRFRGPNRSGNGGYVCGRIASLIDGPASVRLRMPPPLDTPLQLETDELTRGARLSHGSAVVGEAVPGGPELQAPPAIDLERAQAAAENYVGFDVHAFPHCFVCGPHRVEGDGLRIFTGPVEGATQGSVAAPWTVDASLAEGGAVDEAFIWAALDCPSAFALMPIGPGHTIVLGELSVRIERPVHVGETYVAQAWPISRDGRKHMAGSAIHSQAGDLIGVARATWIAVDEARFGG